MSKHGPDPLTAAQKRLASAPLALARGECQTPLSHRLAHPACRLGRAPQFRQRVVALATLAWFVTAYIHAPTLVLWPVPPRMVYVPLIVMPFACTCSRKAPVANGIRTLVGFGPCR